MDSPIFHPLDLLLLNQCHPLLGTVCDASDVSLQTEFSKINILCVPGRHGGLRHGQSCCPPAVSEPRSEEQWDAFRSRCCGDTTVSTSVRCCVHTQYTWGDDFQTSQSQKGSNSPPTGLLSLKYPQAVTLEMFVACYLLQEWLYLVFEAVLINGTEFCLI